MIRAIVLTLTAFLCAAPAHNVQRPARETPNQGRATAVISGVVVSDDVDQTPIRHARVSCSAAELHLDAMTVTDDRGRFTFTSLPAGRYSVSIRKDGWITTEYGAKGPLRPGTPLRLADGQTIQIVARLPHGAVVTGLVLDENGQPSVNTAVRAMRFMFYNGERRLYTYGRGGLTDDRGIYRIYGLPAGDYIVGAAARSTAPASIGAEVRLTTEADVKRASSPNPQGAPPLPRGVAFAATYFPGTSLSGQAARISLRAGEEREGIDFALQLVATAIVEGTVYCPQGPLPAGTTVTMIASGQTAFPDVPVDGLRTTGVAANGTFSFSGISPGQYTLLARSSALPSLSATTDVLVDGERVSGLSLSLQPGLTLSGSVSIAGDRLRPPADLRTVRVTLRPVQPEGVASIPPTEVHADAAGRFTIVGIAPGLYQLQATFPGGVPNALPDFARADGWFLRSAAIGAQDTLDVPIALGPGQPVPPATITFSDRPATVKGTLHNTPDGTAANYTIVLFRADPSLWHSRSRRSAGVPVSEDGTFTFNNLVPGDYLVAAMDDVEPGEWFDPAFLQRIAVSATRIAIAEGEQKVQDLQPISGRGTAPPFPRAQVQSPSRPETARARARHTRD